MVRDDEERIFPSWTGDGTFATGCEPPGWIDTAAIAVGTAIADSILAMVVSFVFPVGQRVCQTYGLCAAGLHNDGGNAAFASGTFLVWAVASALFVRWRWPRSLPIVIGVQAIALVIFGGTTALSLIAD